MGKPERLDRSSRAESIGAWKPTRGSETSQYPEEKKSKETPLVAASERGPGQTGGIRPFGVVGPQHGINKGSRRRLESGPRQGDRPVSET